jgi:signal transduction histidine kinase
MAGVPDQMVVQKIVGAMKSECQFNDTEVGSEMCCPETKQVTKRFTNLVSDLLQLSQRHVVKLKRRLDGWQQFGHFY